MRSGKSRTVEIGKLQQWLDRNPYPSQATINAFPLLSDLIAAMPYHAAGKNMLAEARRIINENH